jgi:hypothetical protein
LASGRRFSPPLGNTAPRHELIDRFEEGWRVAGFAFAAAERKADGAFIGMVGC